MDTRKISKIRDTKYEIRNGSALILAVVLTSLLAVLGVMFLLASRLDWVATSSIGDNKDLGSAVDTVVAQISEVLAVDVPRTDINGVEYYDYPGDADPWLASLEPGDANVWPHITDLYYPNQLGFTAPVLTTFVIYDRDKDYPAGNSTSAQLLPADADGDGASDSMWVQVQDINSSKGKPIYVAMRIIDNGGMLNVNTGYKFDPNTSDGASQTQINLVALSWRPNEPNHSYDPNVDAILWLTRNPGPADYETGVIWRYDGRYGLCTPFDISDELEMRYRFVIDQRNTNTRLEKSWSNEFDSAGSTVLWSPFDDSSGAGVPKNWRTYVRNGDSFEPNYAYRHIATAYNLDRVINPLGQKMVNINTEPNAILIRDAIRAGFADANVISDVNVLNGLAAQITANLIDYTDGPAPDNPRYDPNSEVTVVYDSAGIPHFGFETPCIYISEIAERFVHLGGPPEVNNAQSYAIELYKYWEDPFPSSDPCTGWQLFIDGNMIPIRWSGSNRFHVIELINPNAPIGVVFSDVNGPNDLNNPRLPQLDANANFHGASLIELRRYVPDFGSFIIVDRIVVPELNDPIGWLKIFEIFDISVNNRAHSYQRDLTQPIRNFWGIGGLPTVGGFNNYSVLPLEVIQAHPANKPFTNVGEIGQLFYHSTYYYGGDPCLSGIHESAIRIDLNEPAYQQVFKYLTVMDPTSHIVDPCGTETRIKGRININTAPWFVIAQLPWVTNGTPSYELAQAIVAYRDKLNLVNGVVDYSLGRGRGMVDPCGVFTPATVREVPGFVSIGELMNVTNNLARPSSYDSRYDIRKYATDNVDLATLPDITYVDGAVDDFEERDVIFARISNLVTVRSDVFTAYILVRIGADGPQKRVVAILDRSSVYPNPSGGYTGKVKVLAIQQVPDAR